MVSAIRERILTNLYEGDVLRTGAEKPWHIVLSWVARDQECRLRHPLEWRDSASNSGSTLPGTSKKDKLIAARAFLRATGKETAAIRNQQDKIDSEIKRAREELRFVKNNVRETLTPLQNALESKPGDESLTKIEAAELRSEASERLDDASDRSEIDELETEIERIDERLREKSEEKARLEERKKSLEEERDKWRQQLLYFRSEKDELSVEEAREAFGDYCDICGVPIEKPIQEGCPYATDEEDEVVEHPSTKAARRDRLAQSIPELEKRTVELTAEIQKLDDELKLSRNEIGDLNREKMLWKTRRNKAVEEQRQNWHEAKNLVEDAERLMELVERRNTLERRIRHLKERSESLKDEYQEAQSKYDEQLQHLERCYKYVCRELFGTDHQCQIDVTGSRIKLTSARGGEAITAFKSIAFDLAVLLMTIQDRTALPSFWIHDSPREADLSSKIYRRYCDFLKEIGPPKGSAPFQYILTTTTRPPEQLRKPPWTVLKLGASDPDDLLFRRRLRAANELE
jgi:hypothetical protein